MSSEGKHFDTAALISYAYGDEQSFGLRERWLTRLLEHIQPLVPQGMVDVWSDSELEAGLPWNIHYQTRLQAVKVVVLLVGPAFLASKHVRNSVFPVLLMQAKNNGSTVIPIIVRPCLFSETKFKYPDPTNGPDELPLSIFQPANHPNQPLNTMPAHEQDEVLRSVARLIQMKVLPFKGTELPPGSSSDFIPVIHHSDIFTHPAKGGSLADALIVWDPEVVHHADYVTLITALGDLVRSQGGIGVERIGHLGVGIPIDEDILV
jgi:hypothetical protein